MVGVGSLYKKSGSNDEAKYEMLRKSATVDKRVAEFLLNKGLREFSDLKDTVVEYVRTAETFQSLGPQYEKSYTKKVIFGPEQNYARPAKSAATLESVRSYVRKLGEKIKNHLDNRLDLIMSLLENLTLTIRKNQTANPSLETCAPIATSRDTSLTIVPRTCTGIHVAGNAAGTGIMRLIAGRRMGVRVEYRKRR